MPEKKYKEFVEGPWPDRAAPETDDQLPIIARVGRGLRGDGYVVRIKSDDDAETTLEGMIYDAASGTYNSDWLSENINGGKLMYQYNLRPWTDPQTFTITFRLKRPGRTEWAWTTPAIPYVWDADNDGEPDVDDVVGTGVASLFIKKTGEAWIVEDIPTSYTYGEAKSRQEKLIYPRDWDRKHLNAPDPNEPWTVGLTYGIDGDIDAPNIDDLARILGVSVAFLRSLVAHNNDGSYVLPEPDNTWGDVDGTPLNLTDHIHDDLGFDDDLYRDGNDLWYTPTYITYDAGDGRIWNDGHTAFKIDPGTVKNYIQALKDDMQAGIDAASAKGDSIIQWINANLIGGNTAPDDKILPTLASGTKIPVGNMNVFGDDSRSHYIRTRSGENTDDVWAR